MKDIIETENILSNASTPAKPELAEVINLADHVAAKQIAKVSPSKEELETLYCQDHLSMRDLASKFNVSTRTILRWIRKHGIQSRLPFNQKIIQRQEIEKLVNEGMSQNEMARQFKVHKKTVYNWLKKYGIKTDPLIKRRRTLLSKSLTERNLRNLYLIGGLSIKRIAKHYRVHFRTVRKLLLEFHIPIRKNESRIPEKEELRRLYTMNGYTTKEIGSRFGVSDTTIVRWLRRYGIKLRPGGPNRKKPRFTREELNQYRKLTINEIARICHVPRETIRYWLRRYGIKVQHGRRPRQLRFVKSQLYELYIVKNLRASEIAHQQGISESVVRYWLQRYKLKKEPTKSMPSAAEFEE